MSGEDGLAFRNVFDCIKHRDSLMREYDLAQSLHEQLGLVDEFTMLLSAFSRGAADYCSFHP